MTSYVENSSGSYVDNSNIANLDYKQSVRVATTSNINLSGLLTVDGITLVNGNRVLVKSQSSSINNGIYIVRSDSWLRAPDFNSNNEVTSGSLVFVEQGDDNANTFWFLSNPNPITIGTTGLIFKEFRTSPLSYSTSIGNGSTTSFTVNHNLDVTSESMVTVRDTVTNYYVYPNIKYLDQNSIFVEFNSPPANSQYKVTVLGLYLNSIP